MARRKKTPEVLADQQFPARQSIQEGPTRADAPASQPLLDANLISEKSVSDPLAMLFPHPVSVPTPVTTTIKLTVTATEDLVREIKSSVSQAFGALPNVQLVTGEADWTLVILSVAIQSLSRTPDGVALSVIVAKASKTQGQERQHTQVSFPPTIPSEQRLTFHGTWLRVAAHSQLPRLCRQIVADFAARYLV